MSIESESKSSATKDIPKKEDPAGAKKTKSPDSPQSQEVVPSEVSPGTNERNIVWSSDADNPEPERADPKSVKGSVAKSKGDDSSRKKSPGSEKNTGARNSRRDRSGRSSKFKNNTGGSPHSAKKGRGRRQNRKKQSGEENVPVELGELPNFELFQDFEQLSQLADDLRSGEGEELKFNQIYEMTLPNLREVVAAADIKMTGAPSREQIVNALVAQATENKCGISALGVFELLEEDGTGGLLLYQCDNYRIKALSAYVPQLFVERYGLQRGHIVEAQLHPHRENESCPFVVRIHKVMGRDPESLGEIVPFTEGIPYYPLKRILMESDPESHTNNLSMRVVDCLTPIGFGQRGLIVAPPRTGKTVLMQGMADSIQKNYPDAHLIILLIDERPEEVTDFRRHVSGEVISSTFDESAESHVHAAEMVIEKARRMVETGEDVVILLDSITRLARAYNTTMPNSGKILSGGVEANALQKPKRFFGSARNIEDGGSLTIIATALVETGSKMDEVIFEEFKGTGNMELHLDRGLSDKRIFPALSMEKSGTRKEELLYHPDEIQKIYSLRRAMKGIPSTDAMEMLIQRIKKTQTNAEFLMSVSR